MSQREPDHAVPIRALDSGRYGPAIGAVEPDKLTWVPERSGYYRKVWRRPTIVGPPDAPICLKARRWRVGPDPTLPL